MSKESVTSQQLCGTCGTEPQRRGRSLALQGGDSQLGSWDMRRMMVGTATVACLVLGQLGCGDDDDNAKHTAQVGSGNGAGNGGTSGANAGRGGATTTPGESLSIRFKAQVGDQNFECGRDYPKLGSSPLAATPKDFRFYVQDVRLLTRDGKEVPFEFEERAPVQLKEVALIDFANDVGACGMGLGNLTNTVLTGKAPAGDYTGIVFVNGVPESLNHEDVTRAKPPLNDTTASWNWLSGYRFIMAEVFHPAVEAQATDAGIVDLTTVVHVGSAACGGRQSEGFNCQRPNRNRVKLTGFDPTKQTIVADFGKVFEHVDLGLGLACHGTAPECKPMYEAFGIDIATGKALDTQSVFRWSK